MQFSSIVYNMNTLLFPVYLLGFLGCKNAFKVRILNLFDILESKFFQVEWQFQVILVLSNIRLWSLCSLLKR